MASDLPRFLKLKIWERDNYTCLYCGRRVIDMNQDGGTLPDNAATVDHINPQSNPGSTNSPENLATACYFCNSLLGNRFDTFEEKRAHIQKIKRRIPKTRSKKKRGERTCLKETLTIDQHQQ